MNLRNALERLEKLRDLIDEYNSKRGVSGPDVKALHSQILETYGEVEDLVEQFAGRHNVQVSSHGKVSNYPNYIEAGYLSGSTIYVHEGYTELVKLIGKVRQRINEPSAALEERSVSTAIAALHRFRECCQYVKDPPRDERAVQDLVWVILRSHFDRVDREETLPKLGLKAYRPDFGVPELRLLVEVKYVGEKTNLSSIQDEILADLPAYLGEHTTYAALVVLVYDAAHKLRDPRRFVDDLRKIDGIQDVVVVPGIG